MKKTAVAAYRLGRGRVDELVVGQAVEPAGQHGNGKRLKASAAANATAKASTIATEAMNPASSASTTLLLAQQRAVGDQELSILHGRPSSSEGP